MNRRLPVMLLSMLGLLVGQAGACGSLIVLPGSFAGVEANSSEVSSLGVDNNRYQQVYGNSLLGGLSVGDEITGLTFRLDAGMSDVPAQTVSDYEIRLSRSVNLPGSLSLTFADNRGQDEVLVRKGPLVIGTGDFPGGSTTNPFGVIIPFDTPYIYQGGPLLMEVAHSPFTMGGRDVDAQYSGQDAQTIFGTGFNATTADIQNGLGSAIVVQFQVRTVPEPASFIVLGIGALGVLGYKCRRRTSAA